METEKINEILKKVFVGYDKECFAGSSIDKRFNRVEAYVKKFESGDEINFIPIMALVIDETERVLEKINLKEEIKIIFKEYYKKDGVTDGEVLDMIWEEVNK